MSYAQLNTDTVKVYLESTNVAVAPGCRLSSVEVEEIGDGNWNFVYRLKDQTNGRTAILKQAVPYVRCVGKSWPFTTDRILFEIQALECQRRYAPELVPEIYHVDRPMRLFVMQDLGSSPVLRGELLARRISPRLAEDLSTFMAETLFHTSDWWLTPQQKKEEVRRFLNPHMCSITEDLIFTASFELRQDYGYDATPHRDLISDLGHDGHVKRAVADIKLRFMNCPQAMLHGDLHTGSVMANDQSTYVIDPEFAFYGPIGFDVGMLLANYWMNAICQRYWSQEDAGGQATVLEVLQLATDTWSLFRQKFEDLWAKAKLPVYWTYQGGDRDFARYRKDWLRSVFDDTLAVAGCEMIRRTVGLAKNKDIAAIEDTELRKKLELILVDVGRWLIVDAPKIDNVEEVAARILKKLAAA